MSALLAAYLRQDRGEQKENAQLMLHGTMEMAVHGQDFYQDDRIILARHVLWMTPEERGERQPLHHDQTGIALISDARLDNREELHQRLNLERPLREYSDGQLILRAYLAWKENCVEYLCGDFAFIVWDDRNQVMFFAVDPMGGRNLNYWINSELCLVATEITALLEHPAITPVVNERKLADRLAFLFKDESASFFEDIQYLPPGHCMLVSAQNTRIWRFWELNPDTTLKYKDDRQYIEHFQLLLEEAIKCRLRSYDPVGLSLSGGLDSSAIAALATPLLAAAGKKLKTFSYAFDVFQECDEGDFIKPTIDLLHPEAEMVNCDDCWTFNNFPEWPTYRGFLNSDPFIWLPDHVMKAASRAGCRTLLGGYFGDTLFSGGRNWASDMIRHRRWDLLAGANQPQSKDVNWRYDVVKSGLRPLIPGWIRNSYRRFRPTEDHIRTPWLSKNFIQRSDLLGQISEPLSGPSFRYPDRQNRYHHLTLSIYWQGAASARRQYRRFGLEIVCPYRDRRLFEYIMAVPAYMLKRPGTDRYMHRRSMDGLLPEKVVNRKLHTSFRSLLDVGLFEREWPRAQELLRSPQIVERDIVDRDWLQALTAEPPQEMRQRSLLWRCIAMELWLRSI